MGKQEKEYKGSILLSIGDEYEEILTLEDAWELAKGVLENERETLRQDFEDKLTLDGDKYVDYHCDCDPDIEEYTCNNCTESGSDMLIIESRENELDNEIVFYDIRISFHRK